MPPPLPFAVGDLKLKSRSKSAAETPEKEIKINPDQAIDIFSNQFDSASTQGFTFRPAVSFFDFAKSKLTLKEDLDKVKIRMKPVENNAQTLKLTWNPPIELKKDAVEVKKAQKIIKVSKETGAHEEFKEFEEIVTGSGLLRLLTETISLPAGMTVLGKTGECLIKELIGSRIIHFEHFILWHIIEEESFDTSVDRLLQSLDDFEHFKRDPRQPTINDATDFVRKSVSEKTIHWVMGSQNALGQYMIGPPEPRAPPPSAPPPRARRDEEYNESRGGKRTSRKKRNQK